jgi:hypothetical protein
VDLYIHSPMHLHGVMLNYLSTGTTLPLLTLLDAISVLGLLKITKGNIIPYKRTSAVEQGHDNVSPWISLQLP